MNNKRYSLLQVLVLVILQSVSTAIKKYPDPLNCDKYYIRFSDTRFALDSCPNDYVFNPNIEKCVKSDSYTGCPKGRRPQVTFLGLEEECKGVFGYYCSGTRRFTLCASNNVKIVENRLCPNEEICWKSDNPDSPCTP
jgi:hypothetical protein